jgi:hypothetical protein
MAIISGGKIIEGAYPRPGAITNAGVPGAGTDEVQTLTFGGTWLANETFYLKFDGHETAAILWTATDATLVSRIDTALEALPNIGTSGVTTAAGTIEDGLGTVTVTFAGGNVSKRVVPILIRRLGTTVDGTLAVAETTPGVDAFGRGLPEGSLIVDSTNDDTYVNTGTSNLPVWAVVGSQS